MSRGRSLSDALATLPDLSDKIVKSDDQYCEAGGFSDVYKRQYNRDNDTGLVEVAVKSFRSLFTLGETENGESESRSTAARKMIRRELGIWRRLKHPNVVPFLGITYGFGRQGNASLVSLWMPNGSLQSFLREYDDSDRLTITHRLQLLLDIANGLCYLHAFPVVHGDLSCNNVLLDRNYNACLTDFGYASMVGDIPEASLYLQMTTMKPGTLRWAAPEYFTAETEETAQFTTKSDIYSFGNLGLLILSGKHPWSEIQREAAIIVQLSRGNKPERPLSRSIDNQHWELIERCWSSINDRPCANDVVSSLQQFLRQIPPPLPLVDAFRVLSHSSIALSQPTSVHPAEKNTGKEKKRAEKSQTPSEASPSTGGVDSNELTSALEKIRNEQVPTDHDERHQYFVTQVNMGETMSVKDPAFYLPAALCFYRAIRVYPSPLELIMVYEKTLSQPVFQLVMQLVNMDVNSSPSSEGKGPASIPEEDDELSPSGPPSQE